MRSPIVIDFLAFTIKNPGRDELAGQALSLHRALSIICEQYGDPLKEYIGGHMYTKGFVSFSGFREYYGGDYTGDTLYIQISGQGCSMLDKYFDGGILSFLHFILKFSPKITRLDLAADEKSTDPDDSDICLTHERLFNAWLGNLKVGRADKMDLNAGRIEGGFSSFCLYVGKRKSDLFMRIYDKSKESDSKEYPHWFRCELELHRENAQKAFVYLTSSDDFVNDLEFFYCSLAMQHVRFLKERCSNISRSETAEWWSRFLDSTYINLDFLTSELHPLTLERVVEWVDRAVLGALVTIEKTLGSGFLRDLKSDFIDMNRLSKRHQNLIKQFRTEEERQYDEYRECFKAVSPGSGEEKQQSEDIGIL